MPLSDRVSFRLDTALPSPNIDGRSSDCNQGGDRDVLQDARLRVAGARNRRGSYPLFCFSAAAMGACNDRRSLERIFFTPGTRSLPSASNLARSFPCAQKALWKRVLVDECLLCRNRRSHERRGDKTLHLGVSGQIAARWAASLSSHPLKGMGIPATKFNVFCGPCNEGDQNEECSKVDQRPVCDRKTKERPVNRRTVAGALENEGQCIRETVHLNERLVSLIQASSDAWPNARVATTRVPNLTARSVSVRSAHSRGRA